MQIEMTPDQYRRLLTLVFLGEWIANGTVPEKDRRKDLQETADAVYALAPKFGLEDWVEFCHDCGAYHGNHEMEEALFPMVDQYDEQIFWEVFSHHLAFRDVMMGAEPEDPLPADKEMRLWRRKEQYDEEFRKHGLSHVRLVFAGGKKAR